MAVYFNLPHFFCPYVSNNKYVPDLQKPQKVGFIQVLHPSNWIALVQVKSAIYL